MAEFGNIKVNNEKCPEDTDFAWNELLLAAFGRMTQNFSKDLISLVKHQISDSTGIEEFKKQNCNERFQNLFIEQNTKYQSNLEMLAKGGLNLIVHNMEKLGLTAEEIKTLKSKEGNPRELCAESEKIAYKHKENAGRWEKSAKDKLELVNAAIKDKWTLESIEKSTHSWWNYKIKQEFFELVVNHVDPDEKDFSKALNTIKSELEESIQASKNIEASSINLATASGNNSSEESQKLNCQDLPEKVSEDDVCLQIGLRTKVAALWSVLANHKKYLITGCIKGMIPDTLLQLLTENQVEKIIAILFNMSGFYYIKVIFFSVKLAIYLNNFFKHEKLHSEAKKKYEEAKEKYDKAPKPKTDEVEISPQNQSYWMILMNSRKITADFRKKKYDEMIEIEKTSVQERSAKSKNLGDAIGTAIQIILIILNLDKVVVKSRRKFRKFK